MDKIKHIIITSCNARYGDFLINHWLRSLKDNVNLENIDVLVIDYGLTKEQIKELKKQKVILYKGRNDGIINNVRFRDVVDFLEENDYDQVLSLDGGDLIFQSDISNIFDKNKDYIRIVSEQYFLNLISKFFIYLFLITNINSFSREKYNQIRKLIIKNDMINVGFILAPSKKFKKICIDCDSMNKSQHAWGADQLALTYLI